MLRLHFALHTTCILALCALAPACNDDVGPANTNTTDSTQSDTEDPETDSQSDADLPPGDGDGDEDETETETGDPEPIACEAEQPLGDWGLMLADGDFPNDVPTDVDESCTVIAGAADQLALDCPFGEFALILGFTPAPTLPEVGAIAQVKIHHEPGWQGWPDLWVSVDVADGDLYGMQASSVLLPLQGSFAVPWDPSEHATECGPFGDGDPCGIQVGKELAFTVDGEEVSGWHGTHILTTVAELEFEAWINLAREYTEPPETCDFSPTYFSVVTRRQR